MNLPSSLVVFETSRFRVSLDGADVDDFNGCGCTAVKIGFGS